jgi:RNA polymerase sigma factor (TIGR02999 family)
MSEDESRARSSPATGADALHPEVRTLADQLVPLFYEELRKRAHRERVRISAGTIQTTALVHEAYLKLRNSAGWENEAHFLRAAALAMRHVLVNHAEERCAAKRGGGAAHLPLESAEEMPGADEDEALLALNEALARLSHQSPRLTSVVECRYFGGCTDEETASALGISVRSVRRDWALAQAWLHRELFGTI